MKIVTRPEIVPTKLMTRVQRPYVQNVQSKPMQKSTAWNLQSQHLDPNKEKASSLTKLARPPQSSAY